jgi:hypothetical protein
MKTGVRPISYSSDGLLFEDGSKIEADVIVFATGFENDSRRIVSEFVGKEIADQMQECGGVDAEGEVRGLFMPSGRKSHSRKLPFQVLINSIDKGFWFCWGDMGSTRFFSRFIALQIKADIEGISFEPYTKLRPESEKEQATNLGFRLKNC